VNYANALSASFKIKTGHLRQLLLIGKLPGNATCNLTEKFELRFANVSALGWNWRNRFLSKTFRSHGIIQLPVKNNYPPPSAHLLQKKIQNCGTPRIKMSQPKII
jgi:hypothetical protein